VPGWAQMIQGAKKIQGHVPTAPILSAPMCLAPILVMHTLWIELQTGTSLFMPLLYLYSSCNQLTIESNSFHDCKITVLSHFVIDYSLFVVTNTL